MKAFIFVAAAALSLGAAMPSHAQTTSASTSAGTATAIVMNGALNGMATGGPAGAALGAGAAAASTNNVGTIGNPQWVMGQTGAAPGMVTYDACQLSRSGGAGPLTAGWTQTIDDCYAQRQAQMAKDMGMLPMAYELMCQVPRWKAADVATGQGACSANRQAQPAPAPAQPMVVSAAPPIDYSRPCNPRAGIVEQCTQR